LVAFEDAVPSHAVGMCGTTGKGASMPESSAYLLVLGEREAISWVLHQQKMAFTSRRRREIDALKEGDELFLLTTRTAFHNPRVDRTMVVGRAIATSSTRPLSSPLEIAGRTFTSVCDLEIKELAPRRSGIEVVPIVHAIEALASSASWGMLLRRPLLELTSADAAFLAERLKVHVVAYHDALQSYSTWRSTA
jgi:hypothetical protein